MPFPGFPNFLIIDGRPTHGIIGSGMANLSSVNTVPLRLFIEINNNNYIPWIKASFSSNPYKIVFNFDSIPSSKKICPISLPSTAPETFPADSYWCGMWGVWQIMNNSTLCQFYNNFSWVINSWLTLEQRENNDPGRRITLKVLSPFYQHTLDMVSNKSHTPSVGLISGPLLAIQFHMAFSHLNHNLKAKGDHTYLS